jgi:hypothetical protein
MGVYLTGVYLIGMHLMGVHLMCVHLIGIHLMGMHLIGVHLIGMCLIGVYLMGMWRRDVSGDTIRQLIGGIHNSGVAYKCGGTAIHRNPLANHRIPGIDDALSA